VSARVNLSAPTSSDRAKYTARSSRLTSPNGVCSTKASHMMSSPFLDRSRLVNRPCSIGCLERRSM